MVMNWLGVGGCSLETPRTFLIVVSMVPQRDLSTLIFPSNPTSGNDTQDILITIISSCRAFMFFASRPKLTVRFFPTLNLWLSPLGQLKLAMRARPTVALQPLIAERTARG